MRAGRDGALFVLGSSPNQPTAIFKWGGLATCLSAADDGATFAVAAERIASSMKPDTIAKKFVSFPEAVCFPTGPAATAAGATAAAVRMGGGAAVAYGYYYPPANGDFAGPEGAKPPLLVKAHGGPTSCAKASFNPAIQFWTSRGFGVLDVDYRGSTGHGRAFRKALQVWGGAVGSGARPPTSHRALCVYDCKVLRCA